MTTPITAQIAVRPRGSYPPDADNQRRGPTDVSGGHPIWMSERLKECRAVAPGEREIQRSGQDRERHDRRVPFDTEQEIDDFRCEDDAKGTEGNVSSASTENDSRSALRSRSASC